MKMRLLAVVGLLWAQTVSSAAAGQVLLEKSGKFGPQPSSSVEQLTFEVREKQKTPVLATTVTLSQGTAKVRVLDPSGNSLLEMETAKQMQVSGQSLRTAGKPGTYQVHIVPENAVGDWQLKITTPTTEAEIGVFLIPAIGMVVVALAAFVAWWLCSGAKWRWFWVGAAVWTVGVVLKFAVAIPLNGPILRALEHSLPRSGYLFAGSVYIGLLTGVFEIGITLVAALIWRGMSRDAARGVAVGVGAGSFEAGLIGLASGAAVIAAIAGPGQLREALFESAPAATAMPLFWLVGPVERVIAILCHTSSRTLVLWGVARGRWWGPFAMGFLIMTAIDAVAGYAHLAGILNKISPWWIELAIAPAALVSIPIIAWCTRHWPVPQPATTTPAAPASNTELLS